jgi:lipopolysaccharide/colanic/teichoic acid biosynthesis glycosyltransferase
MSTTTTPADSWLDGAAWQEPQRAESYPDRLPKRTIDLIGAAALLVVTLPLLAVIALAIRFDSPGPILYRQVRVGRDRRRGRGARHRRAGRLIPSREDRRRQPGAGKPFEIIKFRTMVVDAEQTGPRWAEAEDPRVTRCGRFLRATHLDELPQLWNVIGGDMSLVGPRPERPHFVRLFANVLPGYRRRFRARPGITGLAQLENGYDRSLDDVCRKLDLDLHYLDSAGPFTDFRLLLRTIPHLRPQRQAAATPGQPTPLHPHPTPRI